MRGKRYWPWLLIILAPTAAGAPDCVDHSQFANIKSLIQNIAIIGKDDRVVRNGSDSNLEAAQGRIYCLTSSNPGEVPTRKNIMNQKHYVSNATLAFESDVILVSRHMFFSKNGIQDQKPKNCFFEHIASGEIIGITDWEWPPMPKIHQDEGHQDFALLRLKRSPTGAKPISKDEILIYKDKEVTKPIFIVSNFSHSIKNHESLTITSCHRMGFYRLSTHEISNLWGTDCDADEGSSGAQVYVEIDGKNKLFAIVSRGRSLAPNGGRFDPDKLATDITQFDESLFEAYERLKQRSSI